MSLLTTDYIDGIASRYSGNAAAMRLLSLCNGCGAGADVQRYALATAIAKVKEPPCMNTNLYASLHSRLASLQPDAPKDTAWMSATESSASARRHELERSLNQARSSAIRDQLRVRCQAPASLSLACPSAASARARAPPSSLTPLCPYLHSLSIPHHPPPLPPPQRIFLEYGQFHSSRGDNHSAVDCAIKARENCADPSQTAAATVSLLEWACLGKQWAYVAGHLSRVEYGNLSERCVRFSVCVCVCVCLFRPPPATPLPSPHP
jgi:hypothetical protein